MLSRLYGGPGTFSSVFLRRAFNVNVPDAPAQVHSSLTGDVMALNSHHYALL